MKGKLFLVGLCIGIIHAADWTYVGDTGVNFWGNRPNTSCNKQRQSPIDIPWQLTYQPNDPFNMTGYDNMSTFGLTIKNNGHSAQIDIPAAQWGNTTVSGGGLNGTYVAIQLHFHWGEDDHEGSEHTFRGQKYPLELHIVHFKQSYGTVTEALKHGDGLAVLGFFFTTEDAEENPSLAPLISALDNIAYKDKVANITIDFTNIMPTERTYYYRYMGSLTTPECNEVVVWTVFDNVNTISSAQLEKFRELYEYTEGQPEHHIEWNNRPTQNLYDRTVYKNFPDAVPPSFHWGYHGNEGAEYWKNYYQTCTGREQSPIDIPVLDKLEPYDADLKLDTLMFTNYENVVNGTIKNNGHTIQIDLNNAMPYYLEEGGLDGRYRAAQLHFHWGEDNMHGSEHTYEGKAYPLELHIVHYKEQYGSVAASLPYQDGLAVVGFFFEIQSFDNTQYATIINALESVKYKDSSRSITGFSLRDITKSDLKVDGSGLHLPFYRYMGGLTTPPCSEVVTWTVMKNPIFISSAQLEKFRSVTHITSGPVSHDDHITKNYRPTQNLGTRKVYQSYDFKSLVRDSSATQLPNVISMGVVLLLCLLLR